MRKKFSVNQLAGRFVTTLFALVAITFSGYGSEYGEFTRALLPIHTRVATHHFSVEIARTAKQRGQGLMHRVSLGSRQGMLLDFGDLQSVSLWMKNTRLSLDILFIDNTGEIQQIVKGAQPGSLDLIRSNRPVRAALELRAGVVDELIIRVGDRVEHSMFRLSESVR